MNETFNLSSVFMWTENCCQPKRSQEVMMEMEPKKLPSSQFKGVVPQPNGRWGAQIYEKHQRVWLGTFNEEEEAARVYDLAAQRFRGNDAITNFKSLSETHNLAESYFLNSHSKEEIVDMLRKHTYNDELQQSVKNFGINGGKNWMSLPMLCPREKLFDKTVTPSDVGKLNRLVIPKQYAEQYLPMKNGSICKGIPLNLEDSGGKVWRFRYSYWNSSQSYVLTKGWSQFVKEKNLNAGDIISLYRSTGSEKKLYIDWKPLKKTFESHSVEVVRLFGVNISKF